MVNASDTEDTEMIPNIYFTVYSHTHQYANQLGDKFRVDTDHRQVLSFKKHSVKTYYFQTLLNM